MLLEFFFFFKQKTAYEIKECDWSSDVCSSDLKLSVNIITVEDPVEYNINGINQIQVNNTVGLTFSSGLRSILRQDPDVIMVGEIRDKETAELAVQSALTGHMVLSTLHTNSASSTLPRLLEMEIEPFLIASTVNTVIEIGRASCRERV